MTEKQCSTCLSMAGGRTALHFHEQAAKLQCGGPAVGGKTKCRSNGGQSTGPRTELGRKSRAAVKTVHPLQRRTLRLRSYASTG